MDALNPRNMRGCALGTIIGTFGFSYFTIPYYNFYFSISLDL